MHSHFKNRAVPSGPVFKSPFSRVVLVNTGEEEGLITLSIDTILGADLGHLANKLILQKMLTIFVSTAGSFYTVVIYDDK